MIFKGDVIKEETLLTVLDYLEEILNQYKEKLTKEQYENALSVLREYKTWQREQISAEELYPLIDFNDEREGIFEYAESGMFPMEEEIHIMWELILSVLMTVARVAYEKEGLPYPQSVECIRLEQLNSFYGHILDGKMDMAQLYDYFCKQVCL